MGVTKYNKDWEKSFPWLKPHGSDVYSAYCLVCYKAFKVNNQGIAQVKSHSKSHEINPVKKEALEKFLARPQRMLTMGREGSVTLSQNKINWSRSDRITIAEISDALHLVEFNQSFSSVNGNSERYKRMFGADNPVASGYSMGETKVVYIIKFGIAHYLKKQLLKDLSNTPFSFLFDETTTSQVKKQYDGYLLYWSRKHSKIIYAYGGSLFVGHCTSNDLVEHYQEFATKLNISSEYLLHFGMDGPNVNLSFEKKMAALLAESSNRFLHLGSCSLHPVHTGFANGIKALFQCTITQNVNGTEKETTFDLDDFFQDLHFFFKLSSARREDYASLQKVTGVVAEYMKKHAETRWVSMKYVALRTLEQWENLREYFLTYLPRQNNFKKDIKNTQRYIRIKTALEEELMDAYVAFTAFVADDFEKFLVPFQSSEPRIHLLHPGLCNLLYNLLRKFVKTNKLKEEISENIYIDVNKKDNLKDPKNVDIGIKAMSIINQKGILPDKVATFRNDCLKFYYKACSYMQKSLPFEINAIKQAQYLHPEKRNHSHSSNAISNLARTVIAVLGDDVFQSVFEVESEATRESIVDKIRAQWKFYQNEEVKEEWYVSDEDVTKGRSQPSYWQRAAEDLCGLQSTAPTKNFKRIDYYWSKIGGLTDEAGNPKYLQLYCLTKCVFSLSHGNAIPERGFSINKQVLNVHGFSTYEDTIEALRFVKDELHRVGGEANFKITTELLDDVKSSHQRYEADRVAREAAKQKEVDMARQREEEERDCVFEEKELQEIEEKIQACKSSLAVANDLITEAQANLNTALSQKELKKDLVQQASAKLNVGTDRKRKFETDLQKLETKRLKLAKKTKK